MLDKQLEPVVIALGYFDSVHLGHQKVINNAQVLAKNKGAKVVVFTFKGNLKGVLNGEKEKTVFTWQEREKFIKDLEYQNATNEDKDFSNVLKNCERYNFNGHCVYCGHCAPCVKSIDIATVNKYLDLCIAQNEVPETVLNHYQLLSHKASECIKCGQCSKRCPFGVNIVNKMEQSVKLFGN